MYLFASRCCGAGEVKKIERAGWAVQLRKSYLTFWMICGSSYMDFAAKRKPVWSSPSPSLIAPGNVLGVCGCLADDGGILHTFTADSNVSTGR